MDKTLFRLLGTLILAAIVGGCVTLRDSLSEDEMAVQKALLREKIAAIPQRIAGSDTRVFFIGAALSATQDVFRNETLLAQRLFDAKWNTAGQSLVLINQSSS